MVGQLPGQSCKYLYLWKRMRRLQVPKMYPSDEANEVGSAVITAIHDP